MNSYENKQATKKERLEAAAAKRRAAAEKLSNDGWEALSQIPFGQPILVGHYSERRDRAYRGRAIAKIDKSVELTKQAGELQNRADGVGTGGISSDDPDAVSKLERKLREAEEAHALMVERNREAREHGQQKPYATYALSNSRGRISQIQKRIEELERKLDTVGVEARSGEGWIVREDKDDNRILFIFDGKPSDEVRTILKSRGFKWSPTRNAWVRRITSNARFAAEQIIESLL